VNPTERGRRGEDDHVACLQAVHCLLIAVESDELAILRHIDTIAALLFQLLETRIQSVLKHVRHGDQANWTAGG